VGVETYRSIVEGNDGAYYRVVLSQAKKIVAGRLPHPEGRNWVVNDAFDLVSEYYVSPAYAGVLLTATDDDSLNALVYTAIANHVRATLRKNDRARLRRRMKDILREENFIEQPSGFWRRPGDPTDAFNGREADLIDVVWGVDVKFVKWRPDTKRTSPVAERASFISVLNAILDAAGGAVHESALVVVLAQRFGIGPVSYTESLDAADESAVATEYNDEPEALTIAREEHRDAAAQGLEIWSELSLEERRMVPYAGVSARDAASKLRMGKTKANGIQLRLKAKLKALLEGEEGDRQRAVLSELVALAVSADS